MHLSLQQNAEGWFITDFFEGTSRGYGQQEVPARIILEELSLDGFGILARYPDLFSIECQTKNNALRWRHFFGSMEQGRACSAAL
ncbi:hypothetical protein [Faecalibaculum rodentium]|uniref:hypothetical protein n=1 Tax=Faecalibaculum rodentium TaxID=1702221 RepID=UPI0023F47EF0|nr:hypothetical protein [Faecalibaculum rodentium]